MKKLVNKKSILIGVCILILSILSITLLIINNKINSNLKDKNDNKIQENRTSNLGGVETTTLDENIEKTNDVTSNDNSKIETRENTTEHIEVNKENEKKSNNGNSNKEINNTTKITKTENNMTTKTTQKSNTTTTVIKTKEQENNEFRNKLLSKYNVIVGYKDEIDGVYKNSYASPRKIYDDEVISYNLTKIEDALKKYPRSFFSEIKNKWKPISIYLVDYINGYAGGVTDNNNSSTLVILIVATHSPKSSILENTVHHELMHAIDCYFTSKGIYSSYTLEQSIAKYNPEGFSYGVQDNKYVYLLDNPYYFVSKYAKSAYNEDRAEIFSNLMYRSTAPAYLKAGQPINEKAKVITNQINQNFTSASSGNNRWDKLVAH